MPHRLPRTVAGLVAVLVCVLLNAPALAQAVLTTDRPASDIPTTQPFPNVDPSASTQPTTAPADWNVRAINVNQPGNHKAELPREDEQAGSGHLRLDGETLAAADWNFWQTERSTDELVVYFTHLYALSDIQQQTLGAVLEPLAEARNRYLLQNRGRLEELRAKYAQLRERAVAGEAVSQAEWSELSRDMQLIQASNPGTVRRILAAVEQVVPPEQASRAARARRERIQNEQAEARERTAALRAQVAERKRQRAALQQQRVEQAATRPVNDPWKEYVEFHIMRGELSADAREQAWQAYREYAQRRLLMREEYAEDYLNLIDPAVSELAKQRIRVRLQPREEALDQEFKTRIQAIK